MAASDVISVDVLPGNWLARQLRGISDDTQSLLHHRKQSREGSHRPGPFFSLYELDYGGPGSKVIYVDGLSEENLIQMRKDKPLNLFSRSADKQPSKMFQNWKVPQRLLDNEGIQRKVDQIKPTTPFPFEDKRSYNNEVIHKMEDMHVDQAKEFNAKMPTPAPVHHNLYDKVRVASAQSVSSSKLPDIMMNKPKSAIPGSRAGLKSTTPTYVRSATALSRNDELHKTIPKPEVKRPTFDWEKKYTKGVIDKAIRQSNKFANVDRLLSKALLPDARMAALKWLDQASEQDRQVGLEFFQSVSGTKLMGTSSEEQILRLEQVLDTLRSGKPIGVQMLPRYQQKLPSQMMDTDTRLKYLRLLTPATRKQTWQQKTWHHLPVYRDTSIVENKSSILTEPHKRVSRHFVIHPDWG